MANLQLFPLQGTLVNNETTAVTTNGTSAGLTLPMADSYRLILEVLTVSGTAPTLDVMLATSADGGTNFEEFMHFAQATASGQGSQIIFRPYLGISESAANSACSVLGTADLASGATVIAANGPIDPKQIKVRWVVGGTTPSFAWALKWLATQVGRSSV